MSSNDLEQAHQRLFIKDQEINALKVQNRHLISKVEDAENKAKPNQINTQQISAEIHRMVQRTLNQAFEAMQTTLRGVYQQSLRSQQAVEDLSTHSRELENRVNESRKIDQAFYQDKILTNLNALCDRIERQIDQRLAALANIDLLIKKQNESLNDLESVKMGMNSIVRNTEQSVVDADRIHEQVQNHRAEFKLLRGEVRAMIDRQREAARSESLQALLETKNKEIENIEKMTVVGEDGKEDLTSILDLLRSQKSELNQVAHQAEAYLRNYRNQENQETDQNSSSTIPAVSPSNEAQS